MNTEDMRKYFEEQNGVHKGAVWHKGGYKWEANVNHTHEIQQELWEAFKDGVEWARGNPAEDMKQDALCDIQYMAGARKGFILGRADDHQGLADILTSRREAYGVLKGAAEPPKDL